MYIFAVTFAVAVFVSAIVVFGYITICDPCRSELFEDSGILTLKDKLIHRSDFPKKLTYPTKEYRKYFFELASRYRMIDCVKETTIKQMRFKNSTTNLLAIYGLDFTKLNDDDYLNLRDAKFHEFNFLHQYEIRKIIATLSAENVGRLFAIRHKVHSEEYFEWTAQNGKSIQDNLDFAQRNNLKKWFNVAYNSRRDGFFEAYNIMLQNPNTPSEKLLKLF